MSFTNLVQSRYSCRDYDRDKIVERELLTNIVNAARLAPSACNKQPWTFVIIDDKCDVFCRQTVLKSYNRQWIESAPAFIIACGDHTQAWHRQSDDKDHTDIDLAIAIEHICLAATEAGLGTRWVCNFDVATLSNGLNLPNNLEPIAIIPIGYPTKNNEINKIRKNIDEIIRWGNF